MTDFNSAPAGDRRVLEARMSMLPEAAAFVEGFCARAGRGHDHALKLVLIVEELFTNSVTHGYGRECDAPIAIALRAEASGTVLFYEDAAPRYDPMSAPVSSAGLARSVEGRPVGNLGVQLVRELACHIRYAFEDGRNRLWLTMPLGARPRGR